MLDPDGCGGREELGVQGGGTVIRVYCRTSESIFNKRGKKTKTLLGKRGGKCEQKLKCLIYVLWGERTKLLESK